MVPLFYDISCLRKSRDKDVLLVISLFVAVEYFVYEDVNPRQDNQMGVTSHLGSFPIRKVHFLRMPAEPTFESPAYREGC